MNPSTPDAVTRTAALHAAAWKKQLFGNALAEHPEVDYRAHVDGRACDLGISEDRVAELTATKQGYFDTALQNNGVEVFPDTLALIHRLHSRGTAVASDGLLTQ